MATRTLARLFLGLGVLVSAHSQAFAQSGNSEGEPKLCDFARVQAEGKIDAFSLKHPDVRARLAAIDWVRYNHVANMSVKGIKEMGRTNQTDRSTLMLGGLILMANLEGQSKRLHLHSCFDKAFESDEVYSQHFKGSNLSRSASDAEILYAIIEPKDKYVPIFIVTPSTSFNYDQRSGKLTTFDREKDSYVPVDPRSRRWVDYILQEHFEKLKGKKP